MSYNDSYDNRRDQGYGDDRRGDDYGRGNEQRRNDGYDQRDNDGYGQRRNEGYDQRREDHRRGDDDGYGGGRDERRDDGYGSRRDDDGGSRRDDGYGSRRDERRGDNEGYGGRHGGGDGRGEGRNYYDQSQSFEDEPRRQHGGQSSSGTGYGSVPSADLDSAAALGAAKEHSGQAREDNIFASVFDNLIGKQQQFQGSAGEVDEDGAVQAHKQFYGNGGGQEAHNQNIGAAAAMQALKMFTGGGGSGGGSNVGQGGQSQFIGIAMAQAAKLFDQQAANGNTSASASKEGAIQSAAETALKFYMKSQMGGGGSGGGSGGGLGGLMNIASKFLQ